MSSFFTELAKKVAERWLSLLVLPGLLLVAAGWTSLLLGHGHALDVRALALGFARSGAVIARQPGATQALVVAGLLLASLAVGVVVQALTGPVRAAFVGHWPWVARRLASRLTRRRRARWQAIVDRRAEAPPEDVDRLAVRANKIAMAQPDRPTWIGDRAQAVEQVAFNRYGLDLAFGWPRLWLVLPDTTRAEIEAAQGAFASAVVTSAWALPYLAVGAVWWPAALIALVIGVTGWSRARKAMATLADLTEASLDLYGRTLAIALGVAAADSIGPLAPEEGRRITGIVRKGR